jgi:hypothetical protein
VVAEVLLNELTFLRLVGTVSRGDSSSVSFKCYILLVSSPTSVTVQLVLAGKGSFVKCYCKNHSHHKMVINSSSVYALLQRKFIIKSINGNEKCLVVTVQLAYVVYRKVIQ